MASSSRKGKQGKLAGSTSNNLGQKRREHLKKTGSSSLPERAPKDEDGGGLASALHVRLLFACAALVAAYILLVAQGNRGLTAETALGKMLSVTSRRVRCEQCCSVNNWCCSLTRSGSRFCGRV